MTQAQPIKLPIDLPGDRRGPLSGTVVADEVYAAELDRARERSGLDEAVITGEGMIRGRRVALIACEFAFLQMVKISAAVAAHKAAGLTYLVYLRNPTTGGCSPLGDHLGTSPWPSPARSSASSVRASTRRCTPRRSRPASRSRRTSSRTVWWTPSCPRRIWRPSPTGR